MEQRHQKIENLWNSREELTGKNLTDLSIEPGTFHTGVKYPTTELPSSSGISVQQRVQRFNMLSMSAPCEIFRLLRHVAACCSMPPQKNPHKQLPESGAAACCGILRHAVACCYRWCLLIGDHLIPLSVPTRDRLS